VTSAPTVSVITITFNDLDGLKRTVDSVRAQRYAGSVEHIVIDGGSGDDVVDYLSRYEPGFAYWQSEPDGGRYDAMNQGIAHASGDLLWFLHSRDCFSDPDAVARAIQAITHHGPIGESWGHGIQNLIGPDGTSVGLQAPMPFDMRKFLTVRGTIPHQASFFGSSLMRKLGGYDVDFGIAADQLFILRAALVQEPITVERVVTDFDTTGAGSVRSVSEAFHDMRRIWDSLACYPFKGRRTSLAYLRCWEYAVRTKLATSQAVAALKARSDVASGVAMNEPVAHKRGVRRIAHRAVDTLVGPRWGSIRNVRTDRRLVALTFDDGPDGEWTPRILDILAEHQARATFFMLVENARRLPELVHRVVAEGHEVGLHGFDHRSLAGGSRRSTRRLLEAAAAELETISGVPVNYFRPPFGAQTVGSLLGERDAGLETVMWELDSLDWSGLEEWKVASEVVDRTEPGSIILLHDTLAEDPECSFNRARTVQLVVDGLQRRSLHSTTISELLASGEVRRAAYFSLSIRSSRALSHDRGSVRRGHESFG
jgi:peptidoglycan/xylan/chitin deacetylase (PgdA/CDA1 family)/glycosyltransferase involved in cell wall biosynthesis